MKKGYLAIIVLALVVIGAGAAYLWLPRRILVTDA